MSRGDIRAAACIRRVLLPDHLYRDNTYDKWGNIIIPDGTRVKGELYQDESVRKVLASGGVLPFFRDRVKYPRTYRLLCLRDGPATTGHSMIPETSRVAESSLPRKWTGRIRQCSATTSTPALLILLTIGVEAGSRISTLGFRAVFPPDGGYAAGTFSRDMRFDTTTCPLSIHIATESQFSSLECAMCSDPRDRSSWRFIRGAQDERRTPGSPRQADSLRLEAVNPFPYKVVAKASGLAKVGAQLVVGQRHIGKLVILPHERYLLLYPDADIMFLE